MSGQLRNAYVRDIRNEHAQALENIMRLQEMEKKLYEKLERDTSVTENVGNYEDTIEQINNLAKSRLSLFTTLGNMYENVQNSVSNSRVDLVDQLTLTRTVEAELKDARAHMNELNRIKNDKLRMVDINSYFGKRFKANSGIMKLIIMICVPLLLVSVLQKMLILPDIIARYLSGLILGIGLFVLARRSWDVYVRSTMNFDEYDFQDADPDVHHPTVWEYNKKNMNIDNWFKNLIGNIGIDCYGDSCCTAGMTYDVDNRQCVVGNLPNNLIMPPPPSTVAPTTAPAPAQGRSRDRTREGFDTVQPYNDGKKQLYFI